MKRNKLINLCGNIGPILVIIGALFKVNHYPYQNEIIAFGCIIYSLFWYWVLINLFKQNYSTIHKIIWTIMIFVIPLIAWIYYHKVVKYIKT